MLGLFILICLLELLVIWLDEYRVCWKCLKVAKITQTKHELKEGVWVVKEESVCPKCGKMVYINYREERREA